MNPFILVVGIPYFFSCQLTYKHQMLFVYEPNYETGGVFFPKIFRRFIFALIIAQVWRERKDEGFPLMLASCLLHYGASLTLTFTRGRNIGRSTVHNSLRFITVPTLSA